MEDFGYALGVTVTGAPVAMTLIVGAALLVARRDRLASRARVLGIAGCAVIFLNVLIIMAYSVLIPRLYTSDLFGSVQSIGALTAVYGLGTALVECVGLGLLIAAILAATPAQPAPSPPSVGGPPPGYPPTTG